MKRNALRHLRLFKIKKKINPLNYKIKARTEMKSNLKRRHLQILGLKLNQYV